MALSPSSRTYLLLLLASGPGARWVAPGGMSDKAPTVCEEERSEVLDRTAQVLAPAPTPQDAAQLTMNRRINGDTCNHHG